MNSIMVKLMEKLDIDMNGKVRTEAFVVSCYMFTTIAQHANISCSQNGSQDLAPTHAFKIALHGSGDGSVDP